MLARNATVREHWKIPRTPASSSAMGARHLVIGWDGADVDVVQQLGPERLPNLFAAMHRGAWARLQSVRPPATLPNWTTFLTGMDPGRHGVFDFTTRRGYEVRFTAGTVREAPTWIARLDQLGHRCACLAFPGTWPPEQLSNGVFVSGWDAPVAFEADRSFVWPPALHDAMQERFGALDFDVGEFDADAPGWRAGLGDVLVDRIGQRRDLGEWLLAREDWHVFALYFGESDTAAHHLWAHHDPKSPRHPEEVPASARDGLTRVYEALDAALGRLLAAAGPGVELTLVSDHGSGGSSDRVLFLNRALAQADLLRFRPARGGVDLVGLAKRVALTRLPPRLKERLFRMWGSRLPSWLESRARFGAIDFRRTLAFSDELNYFPGVWLNLEGRDPDGFVAPRDRDAVARRVQDALLALRDPWSGQPVVERAWRREELFEGPHLERAPDLLLDLALTPEGYSYNLAPHGSDVALAETRDGGVWGRLAPEELLGRKGRSLPGSHRDHGLFVAAGPGVAPVGEIEAHIADAAVTALARTGAAPHREMRGRVLFEMLRGDAGTAEALPDVDHRAAPDPAGEARVEARLRALGYVD